jgi:putative oxidoreductase
MNKYLAFSQFYLRLVYGITFLAPVADRLGLLGAYGEKNISWGDWQHFMQYSHRLTFFVSYPIAELLAATATSAELLFGAFLILGLFTRIVALGSGLLTLTFAFCMSIALGIKAPLNYSVFVDSGAGFLLACIPAYKWSIDSWYQGFKMNKIKKFYSNKRTSTADSDWQTF